MRTETEIRKEIAALKRLASEPDAWSDAVMTFGAKVDTLEWVLENS